MEVVREEIFGPVVVAEKFSSRDEIAAQANDTTYSLSAGIWTRDISKAHALTSGASMTPAELALRLGGRCPTSHHERGTTPIQAGLNRSERGTVKIAQPYREGRHEPGGLDHARLLCWLDRPRYPDGPVPSGRLRSCSDASRAR